MKGGGNLQSFSCKPEIFFGADALSQLQHCKASKVLVVTDRFFDSSGLAQKIGAMVPGAAVTVFADVTPDPSAQLVAKGSAVLAAVKPDALIALGGGSPMDCAKAMLALSEKRPVFIAIPTTSGSGSEVTSFAIVSHEGVKHPLVDRTLLPDWAILDGSLLESLPKTLIADTGFDVLSHDLEALASTGATTFSDALAAGSFRAVWGHLHASFTGDTRVRELIHEAATMAGLAFDHAGLGVCHALAHALGGRFSLSHGRLNAILLPAVLEFNQPACLVKYVDLAKLCGVSGSTEKLVLRNFIAALTRLRSSLELPGSLSQAGIPAAEVEAALDGLCDAAMGDACIQTNPHTPTRDDLKALLRQVK